MRKPGITQNHIYGRSNNVQAVPDYFKQAQKVHQQFQQPQPQPMQRYMDGGRVVTEVTDPDEIEAAQASDAKTNTDFADHLVEQALSPEEQQYLAQYIQADPQLATILEKLVVSSGEFDSSGEVDGPGTGTSDSVPARLSDGEFVFTKKATDQIGSENLSSLMEEAERMYDGGLVGEEYSAPDSPKAKTQLGKEIQQVMLKANKMPSVKQ